MKILFLTDFIPPNPRGGGAARSVWRVAQELQKRGHDIFVVTSVQEKSLEGMSTQEGITVHRVYSDYPGRWRGYVSLFNRPMVRAVKNILQEVRPDVVHADNIHFYVSYATLKYAKRYAKRVFLTTRDFMLVAYGKVELKKKVCGADIFKIHWWDNLCQARKRFNPFRGIVIKHYLKYVDCIFSNSAMLAEFLAVNGIPGIVPMHNGLVVRNIKAQAEEKPIVLFPARVSPAKGLYTTLEVMKRVVTDVPDALLVVAGVSGDDREATLNYAQKVGLEKNFSLLGWIESDERDRVFSSARVILVPSLYPDPFPTVALDAALYKKPAVVTCFGGAKEFTLDGKTGYVANPFDIEEFAGRIIDLLQNPNRARQFGEAAHRRLMAEFTVEKQVERQLEFYQK